tara:strand:- start:179 stop:367 length:189 start_codon:yes stop_codon:yes gene_type:complete
MQAPTTLEKRHQQIDHVTIPTTTTSRDAPTTPQLKFSLIGPSLSPMDEMGVIAASYWITYAH